MSHGAQHPHGRSEPPAAMSREAAEGVLRRHGLDAAGLAPEALKHRWLELAGIRHPDLSGDAAHPVLEPQASGGARDAASPRVRGLPAWAWAGHDGGGTAPDELIFRRDYSDRNYLKMRLWALSGRSAEEWTLWAFDGQELLPPVATYGNSAIFPEMASAMLCHGRRGFRVPRAVLAQAADMRHELLLLHADGRQHEPPIALAWSGAGGPAHDRAFLLGLPDRLDALAAGRRF